MSFGSWETFARRLRMAWNDPVKGQSFLGAIAAVLGDETDANSMAALLEQLPLSCKDPASLALHLSERQLEAGPSLSFSDQQKLAAAPALNRLRGRPLGMLVALYYADFHSAVVVQQNGLAYQITGTPNLDDLLNLNAVGIPSWYTVTTLAKANPP